MSKETELQNFTRIVENMITEELGLPLNAPTLVIWKALSKYLSQRPTIRNFNYSIHSHNKAYSALYLMYQLVGELIVEAEQKNEFLFEDNSFLDCIEVDSQYTYDDGGSSFSNFGLNLQSTTGQSVTINDDFWPESDEPIVSVLVSLGIREQLGNIFGEDSLYSGNWSLLQQLTSPKKSAIYESPSGKGIEVSSLIKRPSQSYAEYISTSVSDNPDVQRALLELFATPTEWSNWVQTYIPIHPELIDILFPIDGFRTMNGFCSSFGWERYENNDKRVAMALACPEEHNHYNQHWRFSLHLFPDLEPEMQQALFKRIPNVDDRSAHYLAGDSTIISDIPRLSKAIAAGNAVLNGDQTEATEVLLLQETTSIADALTRMPSVERVNVWENCSAVGTLTTPHTSLKAIHLSYYSLEQHSSIDEILALWSQCPNLEEITGDWMQEGLELMSKEDIEQFVSSLIELKEWTKTESAQKILSLLQNHQTSFHQQAKELWYGTRPNAKAEIKLYNDCSKFFFKNWGGSELQWSDIQALDSIDDTLQKDKTNATENQTECHFGWRGFDFSEGPATLDLSNNPTLEKITLYAQTKITKIILTGSPNIKTISIDGANFLEEIIGLEECVNLTSLHLEDSTSTIEGQNEKWGYFESSGQFTLTNFKWGQFSKQLESLESLTSLTIISRETNIQGCLLPSTLQKLIVRDGQRFEVTFPDSLKELFLNPSAKAQVDAIFALPNIERIELMSSITTLPKAASNVQYLSVETPDVEAIKHYAHLHTLDLWTKTTDRNVLRSISGLELKKLTVLQSTTYPKLSEGGLFGTYWAKDLPDFWASFN